MIVVKTFIVIELLAAIKFRLVNSVDGNAIGHLCHRVETYTEQIRVPIRQPVRIRSSTWCLEFPPRCSNYKTEIREVIKVQNITKTRTVEFCCEGYTRITTGSNVTCSPVCRGGCGRGWCDVPNKCKCVPGFTGTHCTEACESGQWGENCAELCICKNGVCNKSNGHCVCNTGWMGEACEYPCPEGFFGPMCHNHCQCPSRKCHRETGHCFPANRITFIKPVPNFSSTVRSTLIERINATEWMRIEPSNSTLSHIPDSTVYQVNIVSSNTSSAIETLNSTIANLTENIDKLTKNLDKQQQESVPILVQDPMMEVTTMKTIQEVILIKPDNPNPAIFVHQPAVVTGQESSAIIPKSPDVIHVITNWQQSLKAGDQKNDTHVNPPTSVHHEQDLSAVISVLAIFSIVVLGAAVAFVILYRRYLIRNSENPSPGDSGSNQRTQSFSKPLPDLPAFTQTITKTDVPEFYDRPSNNAAVKTMAPYSYTTASLYSVVTKNYPRKHSLEHLYDEIKYPPVKNSNV